MLFCGGHPAHGFTVGVLVGVTVRVWVAVLVAVLVNVGIGVGVQVGPGIAVPPGVRGGGSVGVWPCTMLQNDRQASTTINSTKMNSDFVGRRSSTISTSKKKRGAAMETTSVG